MDCIHLNVKSSSTWDSAMDITFSSIMSSDLSSTLENRRTQFPLNFHVNTPFFHKKVAHECEIKKFNKCEKDSTVDHIAFQRELNDPKLYIVISFRISYNRKELTSLGRDIQRFGTYLWPRKLSFLLRKWLRSAHCKFFTTKPGSYSHQSISICILWSQAKQSLVSLIQAQNSLIEKSSNYQQYA